MTANQIESVARAICAACDENPDHSGDCRGNEFRWQDYRESAMAAIRAMSPDTSQPLSDYQRRILSDIPRLPQRQDSLNAQLEDLRPVANRLGMYDAADLLRTILER